MVHRRRLTNLFRSAEWHRRSILQRCIVSCAPEGAAAGGARIRAHGRKAASPLRGINRVYKHAAHSCATGCWDPRLCADTTLHMTCVCRHIRTLQCLVVYTVFSFPRRIKDLKRGEIHESAQDPTKWCPRGAGIRAPAFDSHSILDANLLSSLVCVAALCFSVCWVPFLSRYRVSVNGVRSTNIFAIFTLQFCCVSCHLKYYFGSDGDAITQPFARVFISFIDPTRWLLLKLVWKAGHYLERGAATTTRQQW